MNLARCSRPAAALAAICAIAAVRAPALSAPAPAPSAADRAGIAEARAIARTVGDKLWPNWSKTRFTIDLLTPTYEILLDARSVPTGFTRGPNGEAYRKRVFPPNLEATFPAFDARPVVVIGQQPLTAAKTPTRWTVTLLHEHFHQWQDSWPPYYADTQALGLASGHKSGMWMLNYPFPYTSPAIDARFKRLAARLYAAVRAVGTPGFPSALDAYLEARAAWRGSLAPNDYRYFAFQCWQEGVARYTEYRIARLAAQEHAADPAFLTAAQAHLLREDARATHDRILRHLRTASLRTSGRDAFYAFGAGEALLLDHISPGWHERYLNAQMDLSAFFPPGRT